MPLDNPPAFRQPADMKWGLGNDVKFIIPLVGSLVCLAGCGRHAAAIPKDSFRLTVTDVLSSEDERVSFVTVETRENQKYSLRATSIHLGDGSTMQSNPNTGLRRERVLTFVCSRISPNSSPRDYIKTVLRRGNEVTTTDIREFRRGTALVEMAALTVRDGIYQLSKPLPIGRLNGEALFLTVGNTQVETAKE